MSHNPIGRYLSSIDGLRAIAVCSVIIFHLNPSWLPGGYFGVDVFFVISGFLITGIINRQLEAGDFDLRDFCARRIRRILPALAFVLGVTGVLFCWLEPSRAPQFSETIRRCLLLQGNFAAHDAAGAYWGAAASGQPYLHIWSLGVEEQFYLIFPVLLLVLGRFLVRKDKSAAAVSVLGPLLLASLAWCFLASLYWPEAAFYFLPSRAWELLAGAWLACRLKDHQSDRDSDSLGVSLFGAGLIIAALFFAPFKLVFMSIVPVFGTVMLIKGLHADNMVSRLLSGSWLRFLGTISYSLYLWHWPLTVLATWAVSRGLLSGSVGYREATIILSTFALGVVGFYLIERPLRLARYGVLVALAMAVGAVLGVEWAACRFGPKPLRSDDEVKKGHFPATIGGFPLIVIRGALYNSNPKMVKDSGLDSAPFKVIMPEAPVPIRTPVRRQAVAGKKRIVVWGDSHAMMLAPVLDDFAVGAGILAEFHVWHGGDPAISRPTSRFGDATSVRWLKDRFASDGVRSDDLIAFEKCGQELVASGPSAVVFSMRYHDREFARYIPTFDAILAKTRLVFIQQPPVLPIGEGFTVSYFAMQRDLYGSNLDQLTLVESPAAASGRRRFEDGLRKRYSGRTNFVFLANEASFTPIGAAIRWRTQDNVLLYLDDDHLTEEGARLATRGISGVLN